MGVYIHALYELRRPVIGTYLQHKNEKKNKLFKYLIYQTNNKNNYSFYSFVMELYFFHG